MRKKTLCPKCGMLVSNLEKHLRRKRCIEQHQRQTIFEKARR